MPEVESISDATGSLLGVIRMHGQLVKVFDMAVLLDGCQPDSSEPSEQGLSRRWIVVGHTPGGETHWRVDTVEDIIEIDSDQVVAAGGDSARNVLDLDGDIAHWLTPEFLCAQRAT